MKHIGYCKFCNNSRIIGSVPDNLDKLTDEAAQEILNELAFQECDCEGARYERKKEADRQTTEAYIDDLIDKEELAEAIKHFIGVLQDYKAQSITVKVDDKTKFSMSVGQDGALSVQRVDTMKTQYGTD